MGGDIAVRRAASNDGALYFGNTATNYIFSGNTSNVMAFAVNGAERVRIDSSGKVGINTTIPNAGSTLTISSGAGTNSIYAINGSVTSFFSGGDGSTFGALGTGSNHRLDIYTNNAFAATFDTSGRFGLGTTNPYQKLHLESTTSPLTLNLKLNKTSTTSDYAEIAFQLWNGATSGTSTFGDAGGTSRPSVVLRAINEAAGTAGGSFVVATFAGGANNSTLTEKFRISSAGNVTTTNNILLGTSVSGGTATPAYIDLGLSVSNGVTRDKCKIYLYNSGTEQYGFGVGTSGDIQYHSNYTHDFYVSNTAAARISSNRNLLVGSFSETGTASQRLQITGGGYVSGNFGVGVTNPSEKLEVNGNLKVILDSTSTAKNVARIIDLGYSGITGAKNWTLRGVYQYGSGVAGNADGGDLDLIKSLDGFTVLATKTDGTTLGRVGIGSAAPKSMLDIRSPQISISESNNATTTAQSSGLLLQTDFGDAAGSNGAGIKFAQRWFSGSTANIVTGAIYGYKRNVSGAFGGGLKFATSNATGNDIAERMVIDDSGNVGVATNIPLQRLHVQGNLLVAAGSATGQHITQKPYELNGGTLSWEGSAGQLFSITNNLTSGSIFSVNDVSGIPSIDVDANGIIELAPYGGSVGVGTINPTSKLHVVGDTIVTGVSTASRFVTTLANNTATGGGQIFLNGATGNRIDFNSNGYAAPSFAPRSIGTKIVLDPNVSASAVDYAFGIEPSTLWSSVPNSSTSFKWYAGTTNVSTLTGGGVFSATNSFRAPQFIDSDNTAFYADPSGTSLLNATRHNGVITGTQSALSSVGQLAIYSVGSPYISFHDATTARTAYFQETGGRFYFGEVTYTESENSFRAPLFYDSVDTTYYLDPNSTSDTALRVRGGALYGPNTGWSAYLLVGGNGRGGYVDNTTVASVCTTDGNLHIDAASAHSTYINFYDGDNVYFGNGASAYVAQIASDGSFRSPIFYDYNNTGYYVNPDGGGFVLRGGSSNRVTYSTTDSGIYVANAEGTATTVRLGAAWGRPGIYNSTSLMIGAETTIDFVIANLVKGYFDSSSNLFVNGSVRAPIFYDSNDTGYYTDPAGLSNIASLGIAGRQAWTAGATTQNGTLNLAHLLLSCSGYRLFSDEDFNAGGTNGIGVYNNAGGTALTAARVADSTAPNSSRFILRFTYNGGSNGTLPGFGGFYFGNTTSANRTTIIRFKAKLKSGSSFSYNTNATGTNSNAYWLTSNSGTGKWEEYAFVVMAGDSGTFSSTHYYSVGGGTFTNGEVLFDLASATVYDVTDNFNFERNRIFAQTDIRAPIFYNQTDTGSYWTANDFVLRGTAPTITLRDTNHNTAYLHCNDNILYVLRGANDSGPLGWTAVDGVWPLTINLVNNDATFGRTVYSNSYVNTLHFYSIWRITGSGVAASSAYNSIMGADNDTGNKMIMFLNSSTRTADGGANGLTFRNDGGPLNLGSSGYATNIFGTNITLSNNGIVQVTVPSGTLGSNGGQVNTLQLFQATAGSDSFLSFHVSGDFAAHFGIDGTTNDLFVGGWSYGAVKHKVWHAGNDGPASGLNADLLDDKNTGTSGNTIPLLDGVNTWSGGQTFNEVNLTINSNVGDNGATALASMTGRLVFDNDYSDAARGPNKIQLLNNGAAWVGGFGVHASTVSYYSGDTHKWYKSNSVTSFTEVMTLNNAGYLVAANAVASPIFYDSANTAYYADLNNAAISINVAGSVAAEGAFRAESSDSAQRFDIYYNEAADSLDFDYIP